VSASRKAFCNSCKTTSSQRLRARAYSQLVFEVALGVALGSDALNLKEHPHVVPYTFPLAGFLSSFNR